ncbi:hypothetical protein FRB91_004833 [Serendipita sp. 411]|nr:hypothetical protein FRC16_006298 [Serendipita sp. 398]KAG8771853.1 hypothetical protein FRC15_003129 [Serendipita sp. 397]KAG8812012.1 hypothetical protein FRC19_003441 [Serendipita sp. 401]KAG8813316.1 hypothetical protein FRC18_002567 [Serendipita sp. 400]KAG8860050.1 hypothetical protein FRB91_004833 [Serendipita sp. 411]KAG9040610.1 hypothetical protein FS842_002958 [Serendipita sp. 407]
MIEPVDEKLARTDHHSRQGLRKPGDRAKRFNQKNAPRPKGPQHTSSTSTTTSHHRTHGKRVNFAYNRRGVDSGPSDSEDEGVSGAKHQSSDEETEMEERAKLALFTGDGTGTVTRGVDGIVLDETREAASLIPIEELLVTAYAKKQKKSRADQFDHIRGLGKQYASMAPKSRTGMSVKSRRSAKPRFPHEEGEEDSDWESIGEDGTEAWEYNSEWRAEMGDILNETVGGNKQSYRDAAAVISLTSSFGSESGGTEKTDDLP